MSDGWRWRVDNELLPSYPASTDDEASRFYGMGYGPGSAALLIGEERRDLLNAQREIEAQDKTETPLSNADAIDEARMLARQYLLEDNANLTEAAQQFKLALARAIMHVSGEH